MAQRSSRKRGRRRPPGAGPVATAPRPPQRPETKPEAETGRAASQRPKSRRTSEERNAAVRAALEPLEPGERPWSLKIAVLLAVLIGGGDLVAVIIDGQFKVGGAHAGAGGVILFSVLMLVCAVGMWQLRYWAVLGFQAILAFVILFFSLLGLRAANVLAVVTALIVVGGGGWLFYKLVRVLSRIQMPKYPGRE
ncbi:MAG TPA: hypothetical protein VMG37_06025 [Solirubrobacteraceae bacterium]|nr:hypothetical protein [Solirubrobacteraceae bacterium]